MKLLTKLWNLPTRFLTFWGGLMAEPMSHDDKLDLGLTYPD